MSRLIWYRILTRAFVDGVMNVFSLHIEHPPPPEYPSILRMNGYYKHLEADNVLIQQSLVDLLGRSCLTSLLAGILVCSQDAKTC